MDDSKFSSALIFVIGNYFVTLFIIGLIAAGISLLNKPKPLRVGEAFFSYYLLFAPRVTRFFVGILVSVTASDYLHRVYTKLKQG